MLSWPNPTAEKIFFLRNDKAPKERENYHQNCESNSNLNNPTIVVSEGEEEKTYDVNEGT